MAIPIGAVIWSVIGVGAAVRAFWNPQRALMLDAFVMRCPGSLGCNVDVVVQTYGPAQPVYAVTTGTVVASEGPVIEIASEIEPVVARYQGDISRGGLQRQVQAGERVRIGQQIGLSARMSFSVLRAERVNQATTWVQLEPTSWLAARGLRLSAKAHSADAQGANWCEGGRKLTVPEAVAKCGMKLPAPSGYLLLPVNVSLG